MLRGYVNQDSVSGAWLICHGRVEIAGLAPLNQVNPVLMMVKEAGVQELLGEVLKANILEILKVSLDTFAFEAGLVGPVFEVSILHGPLPKGYLIAVH